MYYSSSSKERTSSTSTHGMVWDGVAWRPAAAAQSQQQQQLQQYQPPPQYSNSSYSSYSSLSHTAVSSQPGVVLASTTTNTTAAGSNTTTGSASSSSPSSSSSLSLVQKYTNYYHGWVALQQKYSDNNNDPYEAQWANYYADLSSRAAHHFHDNCHTPVTSSSAPPPLPPAPYDPPSRAAAAATTTSSTATTTAASTSAGTSGLSTCTNNDQNHTHANTTTTAYSSYPTSYPHTTTTTNTTTSNIHNPLPKSKPFVREYADRCLQQCSTEAEKAQMLRRLEHQITDAWKAGTIDDPDYWNSLPVVLDATSSSSLSSTRKRKKQQHHSKSLSSSTTATTTPASFSYYGPSSTTKKAKTTTNTNTSTGSSSAGFNTSQHALKNRAKRFQNKNDHHDPSSNNYYTTATTTSSSSIEKKYMGHECIGGNDDSKILTEQDYEQMTVQGRSTRLEKEYLRLTAPPKPENVRPLPILQQHLANLQDKHYYKNKNYVWLCSQFKAIRQDCTVQRIRGDFAVQVYETHGRLALQHADFNEFHQCQTQLQYLYSNDSRQQQQQPHENEFLAYRILYHVWLVLSQKQPWLLKNSHFAKAIQRKLTHPLLQYALDIRQAIVVEENYYRFFQLSLIRNRKEYGCAHSFLNAMIPLVRYQYLGRIISAYRPTVPLEFCRRALGFDEKEESEARKWLESCGCLVNESSSEQERLVIVTKASVLRESTLVHKESSSSL